MVDASKWDRWWLEQNKRKPSIKKGFSVSVNLSCNVPHNKNSQNKICKEVQIWFNKWYSEIKDN